MLRAVLAIAFLSIYASESISSYGRQMDRWTKWGKMSKILAQISTPVVFRPPYFWTAALYRKTKIKLSRIDDRSTTIPNSGSVGPPTLRTVGAMGTPKGKSGKFLTYPAFQWPTPSTAPPVLYHQRNVSIGRSNNDDVLVFAWIKCCSHCGRTESSVCRGCHVALPFGESVRTNFDPLVFRTCTQQSRYVS